jgi:hypothetical protein
LQSTSSKVRDFRFRWQESASPYLPLLHGPFNTYALPLIDGLIVGGLAVTIIPVLEIAKWMERKGWLGRID